MNGLDYAILLVALFAGVGGWRQGLVVRLISAAGAVGGLLLAAANVDAIASRLPGSSGTPRLVGVMGSLLLGWVVGRLVGGFVGRWARARIPTRTLQRTDRLLGSAAGLVGVAFTLWLAAPVMFLLPGWPSNWAFDSAIIRRVDETVGLAPLPINPNLWPKVVPDVLPDGLPDGLPARLPDALGEALPNP